MNPTPSLEHLGIAVNDLQAALNVFTDLLGTGPYKTEEVESEGVRTHFFAAGNTKIELLEATRPDSPIARFLEKRGEGLHHVAFSVAALAPEVERLSALGYTVLGPPKPGADGKNIVFLHPKGTSGVLLELCEDRP